MSTIAQVQTAEVTRSMVIAPAYSDEELERFCSLNGDVSIERTSEGVILMNSPTGGLTGNGNSEINYQLHRWWDGHRRGRVFDSSTGFFLANGSLLSPDAA